MPSSNRGVPPGRLVGLGLELAAIILAAMGAGYLLDKLIFQAAQPWGLITGCLLGFVVGMVHVVRASR